MECFLRNAVRGHCPFLYLLVSDMTPGGRIHAEPYNVGRVEFVANEVALFLTQCIQFIIPTKCILLVTYYC